MKIYNVFHHYDDEGNFGDPISQKDLVASFMDEEDAKAFASKYSNPYVYNSYYGLTCNKLKIEEMEIITHDEFDIDKTPEDYGALWGNGKRNQHFFYDDEKDMDMYYERR